jgi:hypothetical protein
MSLTTRTILPRRAIRLGPSTTLRIASLPRLRRPVPRSFDPTGVGPRLYFQKVPEPKSVKNRVHLDVVVSVTQEWVDVQAAADRVVAAGGQILRISDDPNDRFILVGDPEGNEFCLVL